MVPRHEYFLRRGGLKLLAENALAPLTVIIFQSAEIKVVSEKKDRRPVRDRITPNSQGLMGGLDFGRVSRIADQNHSVTQSLRLQNGGIVEQRGSDKGRAACRKVRARESLLGPAGPHKQEN